MDIGYGTVVEYLERAEKAELGWPLPAEPSERELGRLLFPTCAVSQWRRSIVDATLADAILDCVPHNSRKIKVKLESMRKAMTKMTKSDLIRK